jgi:hypothetical protein
MVGWLIWRGMVDGLAGLGRLGWLVGELVGWLVNWLVGQKWWIGLDWMVWFAR